MRGTVAEVEEGVRSGRKSCVRCDIVVGLCLRLFIKREAERRGKAAANTGPSPNSEGRANSLAEEMDELARYRINNITVKSV
ncbi:hypothetical protein T4A_6556 [Trichinella pseudospiralis]|uniref:Uncharacterized protein n=1 Tax=Trichinella pseudospiralis TaxID=6337 RepID=A0A0V1EJ69_TRIPS|nr:hypothetical protein T4A_6556 [Trichinella pseudospiralis]